MEKKEKRNRRHELLQSSKMLVTGNMAREGGGQKRQKKGDTGTLRLNKWILDTQSNMFPHHIKRYVNNISLL